MDQPIQLIPDRVTEVFITYVTAENYEAHRQWAAKIQTIEAQFPGYEGVHIQAPENGNEGKWITVLRFDTPEHLDTWLASEERREILKEGQSFLTELQSHRLTSPFAGWFTTAEPPSVWKQTMLVLLVLYPIVMLELIFLMPLLKEVHIVLATFISLMISVTLVSWPGLPLVIKGLKWWLAPGKNKRALKQIAGTLTVIALYVIELVVFWHVQSSFGGSV